MKKYIILFLLFNFFYYSSYSYIQEDNSLSEIVQKDIENIKNKADTCLKLSEDITNIWKQEIKQYGLKKTLQINKPLFLPIVIFILLYLVWLKNKKNNIKN